MISQLLCLRKVSSFNLAKVPTPAQVNEENWRAGMFRSPVEQSDIKLFSTDAGRSLTRRSLI
ncbi:MAG: hypothetical protein HOI74_04310 [Gammaproteobacteria bacterium]|nr:hypothetical protein [Gammaproteobacteria bacterium]